MKENEAEIKFIYATYWNQNKNNQETSALVGLQVQNWLDMIKKSAKVREKCFSLHICLHILHSCIEFITLTTEMNRKTTLN